MRTSNDIDDCRFLKRATGPTKGRELIRSKPFALARLSFFLVISFSSAAGAGTSFGYKDVVEKAGKLVEKPFQEPGKVPETLLKLNYDQWRNIRFKPENALWRRENSPFEVQFFHPGFLYNQIVTVNIVQANSVKQVEYSPEMFNYGATGFGDNLPKGLGFAGFRLHYPLHTGKYYDEVIAFLGASYFRAVGAKAQYGLSARGLAIDTAETSGEEFPYFREFWLVRPAPAADKMTIYAMLDSPSAIGAYEFIVRPGKETVMDITCSLFPRNKEKKIGIAPLTSLFSYGENINIRPADDFRPEVHDSDGLMVASGTGEWIWRPLINPKRLLVTSFQLNNPNGFGLFQRDRNFDHYQDLESHYDRRTSAWVVPRKGWGKGRVELVQIPTDNDRNDNIVTYWVPESLPASLSYQLKWGPVDTGLPPLGRVIATRTSVGNEKEIKLYLIDFEGAKLRSLADNALVKADISLGNADLLGQQIQKNSVTGGWRLVLHVRKKEGAIDQLIPKVIPDDRPIELRASLRLGDAVLTETWSYVDLL